MRGQRSEQTSEKRSDLVIKFDQHFYGAAGGLPACMRVIRKFFCLFYFILLLIYLWRGGGVRVRVSCLQVNSLSQLFSTQEICVAQVNFPHWGNYL